MLSPDLHVRDYTRPKIVGPRNVHSQVYEAAITSNGNTLTWEFQCPGYQLLDNEMWIEYDLVLDRAPADISSPGFVFEGGDSTTVNDAYKTLQGAVAAKYAPRQAWSLHHAIANVALTINGETVTQEPKTWAGPMARFYATQQELDTVCTMSGGALNSGSHDAFTPGDLPKKGFLNTADDLATEIKVVRGVSLATAGVAPAVAVASVVGTPLIRTTFNQGMTDRFAKVHQTAREQGPGFTTGIPAVGVTRFGADGGATITLRMADRFPVAPFLTWETRDGHSSIPNFQRMRIVMSLEPNFTNGILFGRGAFDTDLWNVQIERIVLRAKWIVPPSSMKLPCTNIVKMIHYDTYRQRITWPGIGETLVFDSSGAVSQTTDVTLSNLRIADWPEKLFIFAKNVTSSRLLPAEAHLEITNLDIDINGVAGKLLSLSSTQLFAMYVRNSPATKSRKFYFDEWQKRYCCVCITRNDLMVSNLERGGRTLNITADVKCHWRRPSMGPNLGEDLNNATAGVWELVVLAEHHFAMKMDKRRNQFMRAGPS